MSALSRLGPAITRSTFLHNHRQMATATTASDPVQKLFISKIREFKASNKGLDEKHQKAANEDLARLRRIYNVEDEKKLAQLDYKFPQEHDVSLRDLDESKALREAIASGEYYKQLEAQPKQPSALLASIPDQTIEDMHLPPMNKPDAKLLYENMGPPQPPRFGSTRYDYELSGEKMTPAKLEREMNISFGPEMPTIHDDKAPERDTVNFPRIPMSMDSPPTRHHIIPESWFRFFYPKTGVTGPYAFAGSFGAFLLSKEWIIMEHELLAGISTTIIFTTAIIKFGPKLSTWLKSQVKEEVDAWDHFQHGSIKFLNDLQNDIKSQLNKKETIEDLYNIRKHDVELQLEAAYRQRFKTIYDDTKRRLEYLVAVADSRRQIAHKNMVNWTIENAISSIGPKEEADILDNCVVNLKQLASKNANAI